MSEQFQKAAVVGATGLAGQAMQRELASRDLPCVTMGRTETDVRVEVADRASILQGLDAARPDLVINCAAVVDVGKCEAEPAETWAINAESVATLAEWCAANEAKLIHISTDHYFTSGADEPHDEYVPVRLVNRYALQKYAAEAFAMTVESALVLRTSIVGIRDRGRPTLAEWAIAAIENGEQLTLFEDAYGSSIDVGSFARHALDMAVKGASGLYNLASSEVYSKADFIRELARQMDRPLNDPQSGSANMLQPPRPTALGLDSSRAARLLGVELPTLSQVVEAILEQRHDNALRQQF